MKKNQATQYLTIESSQSERRIDNYLQFLLKGIPRTRIYQMIRRGEVRVNGSRVKQNYRLCTDDEVRIPPLSLDSEQPPKPRPSRSVRSLLESAVIFEDTELLVLNKPSGMVVHSGSNQNFGVIEYLRAIRDDLPFLELVHRLDRDTSGCLLLAKDARVLRQLQHSLRSHNTLKHYLTLVQGQIMQESLEVKKALKKNNLAGGERVVQVEAGGKDAHTIFHKQTAFSAATLLKAELRTGRTHQIRVHAASIGHPVALDYKYGNREFNKLMKQTGLKRMFLHAWQLKLKRTSDAKFDEFEAPLDEELQGVLQKLS